jgi:hypothetical protein
MIGYERANPAPGDITGPPCSWGIWIRGPGPPGWGSLRWDSKIWSWVLRDLDPRVTALDRPRSNCTSKLQTHPLVREGATYQETHNRQTENKNLVMGSRWGARHQDRLADWPSVVNKLQLQLQLHERAFGFLAFAAVVVESLTLSRHPEGRETITLNMKGPIFRISLWLLYSCKWVCPFSNQSCRVSFESCMSQCKFKVLC